MVGILNHLASTHSKEIRSNLVDLVDKSINSGGKSSKSKQSIQEIGTIPYLLFLASLSENMRSTLTEDIYRRMMTRDSCGKISNLVELWEKHFFPSDDSLLDLIVHLIICCDQNSVEIMKLLFNLSADKCEDCDVTRDVRHGTRQILEHVLAELQSLVHQKAGIFASDHDVPLFRRLDIEFLLKSYFLTSDLFQRRCIISLLSFLSLSRGRNTAVKIVTFALQNAESEEELAVMFEFIKEIELWIPNFVEIAVSQCMKACVKKPLPMLNNLSTALHFQHSSEQEDHKLKVLSLISKAVSKHQADILPCLEKIELVRFTYVHFCVYD